MSGKINNPVMNLPKIYWLKYQLFICLCLFIFMISGSINNNLFALNNGNEISEVKTLLAVFAHPDDETLVGPILAKYALEGVDVTLVTVTDGRLGVTDWTDYEAGDELAAVRRDETICATEHLGINLIHLDYEDQLRAAEGFDGFIQQSRGILHDLHDIIEDMRPDAIVTFGPDGFSNHIDHRIVGVSVTQVVISKNWEKKPALFYVGDPSSILDDDVWIYRGVHDDYLSVRVPFSDQDLESAKQAALCHASQFRPEFVEQWFETMQERDNIIYLRPFQAPTDESDDLFDYPYQY